MNNPPLSPRLEAIIAELLEQKRRELNAGRKKVRVVITGETLQESEAVLRGLRALDQAGYQLLVTFSHSASLSGLKERLAKEIETSCCGARLNEQGPVNTDEEYESLYLPALSSNSLSKIALGMRDNVASAWVYHALKALRPVVVTLNAECLRGREQSLPPALLALLSGYVETLERFGIAIAGPKMAPPAATMSGNKRLITLGDIRLHPARQSLRIDARTLITPAALDEIRHQNISVIKE